MAASEFMTGGLEPGASVRWLGLIIGSAPEGAGLRYMRLVTHAVPKPHLLFKRAWLGFGLGLTNHSSVGPELLSDRVCTRTGSKHATWSETAQNPMYLGCIFGLVPAGAYSHHG